MTQLIELTDDPNINTNDYVQARNIAETLHKHYPGHLWAVTCEGRTGMATIRNLALSATYGYYIRLAELNGDSHYRLVVKAGGEILERFRQRRGAMNTSQIESLPHAPNGFPVFDASGVKGVLPSWARPQPKIIVEDQ
jgi:hypothetical protein